MAYKYKDSLQTKKALRASIAREKRRGGAIVDGARGVPGDPVRKQNVKAARAAGLKRKRVYKTKTYKDESGATRTTKRLVKEYWGK